MSDSDTDDDDSYPTQLRPPWSRRNEHTIDILLAAIAAAVVTALVLFKLLRP